jgi:hypothetical protein
MIPRNRALTVACLVALLLAPASSARAQSRPERVRFLPGHSSAVLRGRVVGFGVKDYVVGAREGQAMTLRLQSSNPYAYFVVYTINGRATDMNETTEWSQTLTETGDYVIRVFMMRAGARREGAAASYTLSVSIR